MKTYSITYTCSHVISVDADSRRVDAVVKIKSMMDQVALDAHWTQKHANDTMPKPTLEQSNMMIEQNLMPKD